MTRTVNSNFSGTSVYDADVDATMFKRVLREIAQDFHRVYDLVSGEHAFSTSETMNHNGEQGRGSLLGIPLINQVINARIGMAEADLSTYGGETYLLAAPVFVPPGETFYTLDVRADGAAPEMWFEVYNTAGVLAQEARLSGYGDGVQRAFLHFAATTTGELFYVFVRCTIDAPSGWILRSWHMYNSRVNESVHVPAQVAAALPVPTAAVGIPVDVEEFHDNLFTDNFPVSGWLVNKLNRSINALWETMTGAPLPGRIVVTNADSATISPATSRFVAHARAGWTAEPLVKFPLLAEAFGACLKASGGNVVDNASPPTQGITEWFAPFPRSTALSTGRNVDAYVPDFPNGVSTSLMCSFLCVNQSGKGTPTNWRVRAQASAAAPSSVALTQLGSTSFYVATVGPIDFFADVVNLLRMTTQQSPASGFVIGEMRALGWSWYFNP